MDSSIEKTQVYVATAKSLSLGLPLQFIDPLLELGKMLDYAVGLRNREFPPGNSREFP